MAYEDFILRKRAEKSEEDSRDALRREMVETAKRIFAKVDGAITPDPPREIAHHAKSPKLQIEDDVYVFVQQVPHTDQSGVAYYAMLFEIGGQESRYAAFNRHTPISYTDESATDLAKPIQADKDVLELLARIDANVNTE